MKLSHESTATIRSALETARFELDSAHRELTADSPAWPAYLLEALSTASIAIASIRAELTYNAAMQHERTPQLESLA